jgi:release factor glutamine methyltransferase
VDLEAISTRLSAAGCVFAAEEAAVLTEAAGSRAELDTMVRRRVAGEPLEQIVGWAAFLGRRVTLAPGVFVPRRRTELLARCAIRATRFAVEPRSPGPAEAAGGADGTGPEAAGGAEGAGPVVVVDLCCGSGAVGAAVLAAVPAAQVHAVDIDPAAVNCARRNLPGGTVHLGDLYDPLPARLRGRVDVIAANAPYVPTGEIALMPPEARLHEPPVALDGGPDGLTTARRIVAAAPTWLAAAGTLLVETSARQAGALLAAATAAGLDARVETDGDTCATVLIAAR